MDEGFIGRLNPDSFYKRAFVVKHRLLCYGSTQLNEKIKTGEIEKPVAPSKYGRTRGWFGSYLIEHQAEMAKAAKAEAAAIKEADANPTEERVIYIDGRPYVPLETTPKERKRRRGAA